MARLEFFFDVSSPWTYLAFSQIEALTDRRGVTLVWRPILVGGVFNAVNAGVYEARANPDPRKAAYSRKDLRDWARAYGLTINWPTVFPVRAVSVMRGCVAAQERDALPSYARLAFEAYWGADRDISQPEVLHDLATGAGLDPAEMDKAMASPSVKDTLKANTQDLIDRGGFGSPTMFIDGTDMYFGNDRLPLVDWALSARSDPSEPDH